MSKDTDLTKLPPCYMTNAELANSGWSPADLTARNLMHSRIRILRHLRTISDHELLRLLISADSLFKIMNDAGENSGYFDSRMREATERRIAQEAARQPATPGPQTATIETSQPGHVDPWIIDRMQECFDRH